MKKRFPIFTLFALILAFSCVKPEKAEIIQEQVIPGELPDPTLIEVDGTFYASGSSNAWGPYYPIYESKDLKNWTFVDYVFQEKPDWTINSFWAPELFYKDGTFYCYYTARHKDGVSMIGVASTKDIKQGFQDHGVIIKWGEEAIDAFVNQQGDDLYITWKAYGLTKDKPITLLGSKLSRDGLSLAGESFEVLVADADTWERGGIEGQTIMERDGYLYMFYSGNACCGANCDYQVGVARAKTMEGPWEKYAGNPILVGNENWKCPGHGTAVQNDGDWYYLYHAYPSAGFPNLGRSALLSQIAWDEKTGWPKFTANFQAGSPANLASNFMDQFDGNVLKANWRFDVEAGDMIARVADGNLILTADSSAIPAFLGINPEKANAEFQTQVHGKSEALRSLTFYVTKDNSLGLGVQGDSLLLWKLKQGEFQVLEKKPLDFSENLFLKAQMTDGKQFQFSFSSDGQTWDAIGGEIVGDNLAWWSWGMKAGLSVKGDGEGSFGEFEVRY
ncbi:family 43 glycosylhydrolase [Algoriphagus aestuariicola]|uniref:Family 43 glycosylhydrolase n=1 Tax=Algoriphagus aestuariicola TaxID=1852016 RepID=A0ABS3BWR3_9BACT|nr:glycoside hydrolase family 43 protein [Algoriphagus aestuariicola]MBN7803296.1 family 43 glycosylhydrolase [Algoriphagus aestuariicola]